MTILIVDDSRFIQLAIDKALREAGYRTILASDGEEGLHAAIQRSPDLILLDIMLPNVPGTSVLRSLKGNPITKLIPIIVLTALTRLDSARLISEGADACLAKADLNIKGGCPVLVEIIKTTLARARPEAARPQPTTTTATPS
jgi:CheY-like chemotaxis protein